MKRKLLAPSRPWVSMIVALALTTSAAAGTLHEGRFNSFQALRETLSKAKLVALTPQLTTTQALRPALKGETIVVLFWTSWCQFCAKTHADLSALDRRISFAGKKLRLVSVALDDDIAAVKKSNDGLKSELMFYAGPGLREELGIGAVPLILIFAEDRLDSIFQGYRSDKRTYFAKRVRWFITGKETDEVD